MPGKKAGILRRGLGGNHDHDFQTLFLEQVPVVAPKSVGSMTTKGQMKPKSWQDEFNGVPGREDVQVTLGWSGEPGIFRWKISGCLLSYSAIYYLN